jgi:hypothetical protein
MPWGSNLHERGGFYTDFLSESKEKTVNSRGVLAERQQARAAGQIGKTGGAVKTTPDRDQRG